MSSSAENSSIPRSREWEGRCKSRQQRHSGHASNLSKLIPTALTAATGDRIKTCEPNMDNIKPLAMDLGKE